MTRFVTQRSWFDFAWLRGWSRWERLIVAASWLAPIVTLLVGGRARSGLAAGFLVLALAVLNVVVHRHGGWGLLGPHFFYDVVRLARRGRSNVLRIVYIAGLFLGLWLVYVKMPHGEAMRVNDFAEVAESFAVALFQVQNIAVLILAPAYLGSAIAEERERRTLELLFTTPLSDREIILGKLCARIIHLVGFVLAGWPVLCLIQFWGGIDMLLIAGNLAHTLLLIFSVGSFCLLVSTMMRSVTAAVVTSYAILAPTAFCCVSAMRGFPLVLQDARSGVTQAITVQDLPVLFLVHGTVTAFCLGLAWLTLRGHEYFDVASLPERPKDALLPELALPIAPQPRPGHNYEPGALDAFAIPYTLPPITDHALWWKERHVGGPPLLFSPVVLVPMLPFALTGGAIMVFWFVVTLSESDSDLERSRERWGAILRFFYYAFLGCYILGVSFHAAASVARERQQQTLEPLLLLPIDRREILAAKWLATLVRGWPWLALILGDVLLGLWMGAYHPWTAVMFCLAPWPMIVFFATFALLQSVLMRTVLRAYLVMVVLIVTLLGCTIYGAPPFSHMEAVVIQGIPPRTHPSEFAVYVLAMMTIYGVLAAACWKLAVRRFEDRGTSAA